MFTDFLSSPGEAVVRVLRQPSIQWPNLQGLLGGLIHLLEAIGGAYHVPNKPKYAGQNPLTN